MLIKLACIIIIGFGIYYIIRGILYYRAITKEDREYAKELKEAKKRWKLEEKEKITRCVAVVVRVFLVIAFVKPIVEVEFTFRCFFHVIIPLSKYQAERQKADHRYEK